MNRNDKIYTRDSSLQEWRIIDPSLVLGDFKGDLLLDGQAKLDALTSVGGDLRLYGQAKLDLITDLRPWQEEMEECEKAFAAADPQVGDWCAWLHHEVAFERLEEPWRNRFNYVRDQKSVSELAWRFRIMRPSSLASALAAARAAAK